jgi:2-methylisocitrate lyase-like PEP mutase family enzyme
MGFGIRSRATTPLIPVKRLEEIGVARVSLPRMLPAAAIAGMKKALEVMLGSIQSGEAVDRPDLLVGIEEIMALIGDDQVSALEERFLLPEQLQSKYK